MFNLAVYYRMVGGFIGTGSTTLARLRFSLTMALYMTLASAVHHESVIQAFSVFLLVTLMTFVGRLIPHSAFQSKPSFLNSLAMSIINMFRLFLIAIPFSVGDIASVSDFHPGRLALAFIGTISGIGYYIGLKYFDGLDCGIYYRNHHGQWRIGEQDFPRTVPPAVLPDPNCILDQCAVSGSEWGELITGMAYEIFFIAALVSP